MKPYAVIPDQSRGRCHPDPFCHDSDPFVLDRFRVLHCTAFRRLQYKTQVFVSTEDDHFRTRLTHTLEVAGIARRIAQGLDVNEVLAETIALAHDLGHPPFGHAGEKALASCMNSHGGFEHNTQSLRVVEYLEHPYPAFRGLNLTQEVREGLAKHHTVHDHPDSHVLADGTRAPLEAQIACVADRIAYDCHDLEDAIGAELLQEADLRELSLWRDAALPICSVYPDRLLHAVRRPVLDAIENRLMTDVIAQTECGIRQAHVQHPDDIRKQEKNLVDFSPILQTGIEAMEAFLADRVYRHPNVIQLDQKAGCAVDELFTAYIRNPDQLPPRYRSRISNQGLHRVICDYIAGMTDRFCLEERNKAFKTPPVA